VNAGIRIVVDGASTELAVDAASVAARRELGVVAWSVLEAVALTGGDEDGAWVATTNVRDLAERLGTGKDRVAAALGVLRAAGLVVAHTSRETRTSRFVASRYEVRIPVSRNIEPSASATPPRPQEVRRPARRRDTAPPEALDLFSASQ
jgi:DNA-binding transcriptional ArsR family regulator